MADRRAHRESIATRLMVLARSLLGLALIAVVVPALLVFAARQRFGGASPLHGVAQPAEWNADRIGSALTDQLTNDTIADIVIRLSLIVAWVAVGVLLLTVVAEVVHMLRHDGLALPDVRGLGVSQRPARAIASGLLVIVPLFTSPSSAVGHSSLSAHPGAPAAVESTADASSASPASSTPVASSTRLDPSRPTSPVQRVDSDSVAVPSATSGQYVVQPGDSVFGIAERLAGPDPSSVATFAERLVDVNLGRRMPDGRHFTNAAFIDVGWVLDLPPGANPGAGPDVGAGGGDSADIVADDPPADAGVHVVAPGESLWSIADDELGDPRRWPEVYEANQGRTFADGGVLDDPDLIQPGWALDVPVDDTSAGAVVGDEVDGETPDATPLNDIIEPAVAPATPEPDRDTGAAGTAARFVDSVDSAARTNPDVASPETAAGSGRRDNVWDPPAADGAASVGRSASAVSDSGSAGEAAGGATRDTNHDGGEPGPRVGSDEAATLGFAGAAMLSAGALTLLGVRRRNQLRRARPRATLPSPAARPAATERGLRSIGAGERFARVETAVRGAARPVAASGERVLACTVATDGSLELVVTGPVELPGPWEGSEDTWRLSASTPLELLSAAAEGVGVTCPTLVQLGIDANDREVYVDLEAFTAIEVGGPGHQADAVVSAVAATLAGSVLAEVTTLVGLGVPDAAFLGHRLYTPVTDSSRAFEAATEAIGSTGAMTTSTFELRARGSAGDTWEPAVVLVGSAAGTVPVPSDRNGLAVVSAAPILGPSSRLAPDGDAWTLMPAGIRLTPVGLSTDDAEAISELVTVVELEPEDELAGARQPWDRSALIDDRTIVTTRDDAPAVVDDVVDDVAGTIDAGASFTATVDATPLTDDRSVPGPADGESGRGAVPATPTDDGGGDVARHEGQSMHGPTAPSSADRADAEPVDRESVHDPAAAPSAGNRTDPEPVENDSMHGPATAPPTRDRPHAEPARSPATAPSARDRALPGDVADASPPYELLVRLLGPVDVVDPDGAAVSFERSKTRELIAWLATHRDRATRSAARTAMWELDVRDATFANVVSEARRSLARLVEPPAGDEWVGRTMTDSLPLHPLVITDADLVRHALDAARLQPPAQAIDTLAPAVDLIAGMPFAGTSYLWPDSEGITSNLVLLATSATTELAAHCLSTGDVEGVFRATGRGLQVLPGHEQLIGLRMEARARSGDHAGVRQEWEAYERVINADPWSDGEPAPKLVELRRRLLDPAH